MENPEMKFAVIEYSDGNGRISYSSIGTLGDFEDFVPYEDWYEAGNMCNRHNDARLLTFASMEQAEDCVYDEQ